MTSVFLSYAREDETWARDRSAVLRAVGLEVFLDIDSLRAGDIWPKQISCAIQRSERFILGWSRYAKSSSWVEREWREALRVRQTRVAHFLLIETLDATELPPELADTQAQRAAMYKEAVVVEIVIEKEYDAFQKSDEDLLRFALAAFLSTDTNAIQVKQKRRGSVRVWLGMKKDYANTLLDAFRARDARLQQLLQLLAIKDIRTPTVSEELFGAVPFLSRLTHDAQQRLLSSVNISSYSSRRVLLWEGEKSQMLQFVISGYCKAVTAGPEGQETLLSILGPGDIWGLAALAAKPSPASVVALEHVRIASVDVQLLLDVVSTVPAASIELIRFVAASLPPIEIDKSAMRAASVPAKLAQALLRLAVKNDLSSGAPVVLPFRLSRVDLGKLIGASPEVVDQHLHELVDGKAPVLGVEEDGRYVIHDVSSLMEIAESLDLE